MAVSKVAKESLRYSEITIDMSTLSFVAASGWYRANIPLTNAFGNLPVKFVQAVYWQSTPCIAQLDYYGTNLQLLSPKETGTGNVIVRGFY